jgi:hypothetical protein
MVSVGMGIDPRRYDQRSSYYRLTELIKALNETNEEVNGGKIKEEIFWYKENDIEEKL